MLLKVSFAFPSKTPYCCFRWYCSIILLVPLFLRKLRCPADYLSLPGADAGLYVGGAAKQYENVVFFQLGLGPDHAQHFGFL
jgi:hypothetical protein